MTMTPSFLTAEQVQAWARLRIVSEQQKAMYGLLFSDYSTPIPQVAQQALAELVGLHDQGSELVGELLESISQKELAR